MDRTLLALVVLSVGLLALQAPHMTLAVAMVIVLSAIAIRGSWAILQSLSPKPAPQRID